MPPGFDVPGCLVREGFLVAADVTAHQGVRVTTLERTAFDCVLHLPRLEAVTALDQFLRAGVRREALAARGRALSRAGEARRLREVLRLADRGAASPPES
ncbi:hypothetical protein Misp01_46460 [Microtetraspora sp. NBRC 13810]|nr:hypothetical protein Misp01_46460 [Microtetraspora sp. NBRC 13810]